MAKGCVFKRVNMTPKEKAVEMYLKFKDADINEFEFMWKSKNGIKELALIAVDEILKIDKLSNGYADNILNIKLHPGQKPYWIQVKQEINQL